MSKLLGIVSIARPFRKRMIKQVHTMRSIRGNYARRYVFGPCRLSLIKRRPDFLCVNFIIPPIHTYALNERR